MLIPQNNLSIIHDAIKDELYEKFKVILAENEFILGKELAQFESTFAAFCNTKYALGVSSGYDALFIALKVLGIKAGDEVIVPAHTFIATWMAVSACGATPIPVEIHPQNWTIDPSLIEEKITSKTKAIIPVQLFGSMCAMSEIEAVANKHKLFIVEDFSQAQGATYENIMAGSFGNINAASLYPGKNIGALGDAGVITTNDKTLYNLALQFRNYGSIQKNMHSSFGVNARLDNLQAAFLNVKMQYLSDWNKQRMTIANVYREKLKPISQLQMQEVEDNIQSVFHQFVILVNNRDQFLEYLNGKGIQTNIHYPIPIYKQPMYRHLYESSNDFMKTNEICEKGVSLPIFPGLKEEEVHYICEVITQYFEAN